MTERISIPATAGPVGTAAITAVIAELLHEEAVQASIPPRPPRPSTWVAATRPREMPLPLPSDSYEAVQWAERTDETQTNGD